MKLRFTRRAYDDLVNIDHYIAEEQQQPRTAKAVLEKINRTLHRIQDMPHIGREGYFSATRELTIAGLPFCAVYRINKDTIEILTIFHESQNPDKKIE